VRPALPAHLLSFLIMVVASPLSSAAERVPTPDDMGEGYHPLPAQAEAAPHPAVPPIAFSASDGMPTLIANVAGRRTIPLDGTWQAMIDAHGSGIGEWKAAWRDRTPQRPDEFYEYGFDDAFTLQVPGDFNTQRPELHWLEGSVWYRRSFDVDAHALRRQGRRLFVHFGAANYRADVFLNGEPVGSHEGGFTPFQFELTDRLVQGANRLLVHVDNRRRRDA
jgi:beta-glucuronidase